MTDEHPARAEPVPARAVLAQSAALPTVELSAGVHRDLLAYAEVLARETGQGIAEPTKLIALMLARFMATDRVFAKARRATQA